MSFIYHVQKKTCIDFMHGNINKYNASVWLFLNDKIVCYSYDQAFLVSQFELTG